MALFIKGPMSARPETADKGTQFWDQNSNITYTFDGDRWVDSNEPIMAEAPKVEEIAAQADTENPAPKKRAPRKTKKEE